MKSIEIKAIIKSENTNMQVKAHAAIFLAPIDFTLGCLLVSFRMVMGSGFGTA